MAHHIANELQRANPQRSAEFRIEDDLSAAGDPRLLRVVLVNLLDNAWKFTSRKEHACIQFGAATQDGQQAFYVRDNGAGFDMRYSGKLFGPFQRLHARNEIEGTGIGLATVKRIIAHHGGRVWAEGTPGEGATFYFTLGTEERHA